MKKKKKKTQTNLNLVFWFLAALPVWSGCPAKYQLGQAGKPIRPAEDQLFRFSAEIGCQPVYMGNITMPKLEDLAF